jgi:type I restriction enzyme M protein
MRAAFKQSREDVEPHTTKAERIKAEVVSLKEKMKALKSSNSGDKIEALARKAEELERAARAALAEADALDAAVFDLRAVNPNAVVRIDTRTPEEVIQSIASQGEIVAQALRTLTTLLQPSSSKDGSSKRMP